MNKVAVMVDTVSELSKELADEYNIKLAPMTVVIDGTAYPETEIDVAWYREQIPKWKAADKVPTSSGVALAYFLDAYRELSQKAEAIIFIGHSSKFGMTSNVAMQAKKMVEAELPQTAIEVVDSYTVAGAQMLIAIEAARVAAAGKSFPQVVELANKLVRKVNYVVLLDDLSLLAKGGRIHKARPWADSKVTNTALLEASISTGGQMTPLARCRTRPQALEKLFETVEERSRNKKLHVAINHVDSLAEAEELKELTSARFPCAEVFITPLYPLVINHVGLRAIQFSWWSED